MTRVLLADDHQLFRDALRLLLEKEIDVQIVAETGNGLDVVMLSRDTHPNIVCMDVNMPGMNGIEATQRLLASYPDIKVIGLSSMTEQSIVLGMLEVGASGYVSKGAAGNELVRAIRTVRNGQKYFCDEAAAIVMVAKLDRSNNRKRSGVVSPIPGAQERQIRPLIAEGHSSSRISALLDSPQSTVDAHQPAILRELDLQSVAAPSKILVRDGRTAD